MKCSNCIPTPLWGAVFVTNIDGVCSGRCEPCLDCFDRARYTQAGVVRCFGGSPLCTVPPPDAFEIVVGVTLEDWMAADTPEAFAELLRRRDA